MKTPAKVTRNVMIPMMTDGVIIGTDIKDRPSPTASASMLVAMASKKSVAGLNGFFLASFSLLKIDDQIYNYSKRQVLLEMSPKNGVKISDVFSK